MAHDIVIRNGLIVDGSGTAPFMGDVAIDGGMITAIGAVPGQGAEEIDASGHVVTPGFIDLHTHLDAQIGWDPALTPVSGHGVTTALLGNCGITFAPCHPDDREKLATMMEAVEDSPRDAILTGLPWSWEDYGGYLDALDKLAPGINVAGLIGHCAVRYYVMGERAVAEQASEDEIQRMSAIVAEAVERGAFGFSTNRYEPHKLPDGRSIPGTFADVGELLAVGREVGGRGGVMQAVGATAEVLESLADTTGSRVLFSFGAGDGAGHGKAAADWLNTFCATRDVTAITQVRGSGFMFGLQSILPFRGETWSKLRRMRLSDRLVAIADPATHALLVTEGGPDRPEFLTDLYYLGSGESPDYAAPRGDTVQALARPGESFVELFLRLALESQGRGLFNLRMFNKNIDELADLLASPNIFPSLGDAGAHVSQIMDAGWSTFVLSYWIRDRGLYSLEEGIRRLTAGPARVLGLSDRGLLVAGKRADINVIDMAAVNSLQPRLVHDFPGKAPRYIQAARGYKATLVNGVVNMRDGLHTGARAGMVLRHQQASA